MLGSLKAHREQLVSQKIELEKYIIQLQRKVQRASVSYSQKDFVSFLSAALAQGQGISFALHIYSILALST